MLFKNLVDVPLKQEISPGDTVFINSGDETQQIDATKIKQDLTILPLKETSDGTENVYINDNGESKQIPISEIGGGKLPEAEKDGDALIAKNGEYLPTRGYSFDKELVFSGTPNLVGVEKIKALNSNSSIRHIQLIPQFFNDCNYEDFRFLDETIIKNNIYIIFSNGTVAPVVKIEPDNEIPTLFKLYTDESYDPDVLISFSPFGIPSEENAASDYTLISDGYNVGIFFALNNPSSGGDTTNDLFGVKELHIEYAEPISEKRLVPGCGDHHRINNQTVHDPYTGGEEANNDSRLWIDDKYVQISDTIPYWIDNLDPYEIKANYTVNGFSYYQVHEENSPAYNSSEAVDLEVIIPLLNDKKGFILRQQQEHGMHMDAVIIALEDDFAAYDGEIILGSNYLVLFPKGVYLLQYRYDGADTNYYDQIEFIKKIDEKFLPKIENHNHKIIIEFVSDDEFIYSIDDFEPGSIEAPILKPGDKIYLFNRYNNELMFVGESLSLQIEDSENYFTRITTSNGLYMGIIRLWNDGTGILDSNVAYATELEIDEVAASIPSIISCTTTEDPFVYQTFNFKFNPNVLSWNIQGIKFENTNQIKIFRFNKCDDRSKFIFGSTETVINSNNTVTIYEWDITIDPSSGGNGIATLSNSITLNGAS